MQLTDLKASSGLAATLPLAFVLAGVFWSPLFFSGAFLVYGAQIANKNKPLGISIAAIGLVYFMFVFGYGMGKDLALRDNSIESKQSTLGSP